MPLVQCVSLRLTWLLADDVESPALTDCVCSCPDSPALPAAWHGTGLPAAALANSLAAAPPPQGLASIGTLLEITEHANLDDGRCLPLPSGLCTAATACACKQDLGHYGSTHPLGPSARASVVCHVLAAIPQSAHTLCLPLVPQAASWSTTLGASASASWT